MSPEERAADVQAKSERARERAANRAATTDADRAAAYDLEQSIDALRLKFRRQ